MAIQRRSASGKWPQLWWEHRRNTWPFQWKRAEKLRECFFSSGSICSDFVLFCCRWLWDCPKMVIPSTRPCIKLTSHVPADGDDLADRLGSSRQALWFDTDTFSAYIPLCLWLQGFSTRALYCCPAIWYPANPSGLVICFVDCWLLNRWGK